METHERNNWQRYSGNQNVHTDKHGIGGCWVNCIVYNNDQNQLRQLQEIANPTLYLLHSSKLIWHMGPNSIWE